VNQSPIVRRGEVWMADLGEPVGNEQGFQRPVLVVSVNEWNQRSRELVIVIPITSRTRDWPTHIAIPTSAGLRMPSFGKVEDLRSISVRRLTRRLGSAPDTAMTDVDRVMRMLLGL
jgi:mRNA interferase MazF